MPYRMTTYFQHYSPEQSHVQALINTRTHTLSIPSLQKTNLWLTCGLIKRLQGLFTTLKPHTVANTRFPFPSPWKKNVGEKLYAKNSATAPHQLIFLQRMWAIFTNLNHTGYTYAIFSLPLVPIFIYASLCSLPSLLPVFFYVLVSGSTCSRASVNRMLQSE